MISVSVTYIIRLLSFCLLVQAQEITLDKVSEISAAIGQLKGGIADSNAGIETLQRLPLDKVVPFVVNALRNDPDFRGSTARANAYQLLIGCNAQIIPIGCEQLIACLDEPKYRSLCANGLWNAPADCREAVISGLGRTLLNSNEPEHLTGLADVIRTLGRYGDSSSAFLDQIREFFENRKLDENVRAAAAYAMLRIDPVEQSVRFVDDSDLEIVLGALGRFAADTAGTFDTDRNTRKALRSIAHTALRHPRNEVRKIALQALGLAYGDEIIVGNMIDGYDIDSEYKEALAVMAREDPDESLRKHAEDMVAVVEKRLQTAIRRREHGLEGHMKPLERKERDGRSP